jgi:anaerobic glycerol-3-phosphate dehydrogenase
MSFESITTKIAEFCYDLIYGSDIDKAVKAHFSTNKIDNVAKNNLYTYQTSAQNAALNRLETGNFLLHGLFSDVNVKRDVIERRIDKKIEKVTKKFEEFAKDQKNLNVGTFRNTFRSSRYLSNEQIQGVINKK